MSGTAGQHALHSPDTTPTSVRDSQWLTLTTCSGYVLPEVGEGTRLPQGQKLQLTYSVSSGLQNTAQQDSEGIIDVLFV